MDGDAPCSGRDPWGDLDDAAADRGGRGLGVRSAGDGPGGAGQVVRGHLRDVLRTCMRWKRTQVPLFCICKEILRFNPSSTVDR